MSDGILAAIDFSDITEQVVAEAVRLAKALNMPLRLLHVAAGEPEPELARSAEVYRSLTGYWIAGLRKQLEGYRRECEADGLEVSATIHSGIPVKSILYEAERVEAAFLVLGSHGHGRLHDLVGGSVCQGVLRRATCPVVVIPAQKPSAQQVHADADGADRQRPPGRRDSLLDSRPGQRGTPKRAPRPIGDA